MEERTRYSDADLQEFKAIIQQKIEKAEKVSSMTKTTGQMTPRLHSKPLKKELKHSAKNKMRYWQAGRKNSSVT